MTKFFQLLVLTVFAFALTPLPASAKSVGNTDSEPPKECGVLSDADRKEIQYCNEHPEDTARCENGKPKGAKTIK